MKNIEKLIKKEDLFKNCDSLCTLCFELKKGKSCTYTQDCEDCEFNNLKNILNFLLEDYSKLKPCPFCGKRDTLEINFDEGNANCQIICNFNKGGCGSSSGFRHTEDEAIKLWNTRKEN